LRIDCKKLTFKFLLINLLLYKDQLLRKEDKIFDPIRKIWIVCTNEEFVRQLVILDLLHRLHYGSGRIAVEKKLQVSDQLMRFDIVVFDQYAQPYILIECKSFEVRLHDSAIYQAARYNLSLKAPFVYITNGLRYQMAKVDFKANSVVMIDDLPQNIN